MLKLFKSKEGIILMSIIWGLGISCLFRQVCTGRDCIIIKAPNPKNIVGKVYKLEDKCYQYIPHNSECTADAVNP
jgi:hypothetical protein